MVFGSILCICRNEMWGATVDETCQQNHHCSQGPHKLLFISALSQHFHRHCITQTWIYMKHLWFSFPFFRTHTSCAFNNNLFIAKVYIPNRICILCEFTIIEEFSHTLLILSLKVSDRVAREDIKIILHWNMPRVLLGNEGLKRKELRAKLRQLWFPPAASPVLWTQSPKPFVPVTQVSASPFSNIFVPKYVNMNLGKKVNMNHLLPSSQIMTNFIKSDSVHTSDADINRESKNTQEKTWSLKEFSIPTDKSILKEALVAGRDSVKSISL